MVNFLEDSSPPPNDPTNFDERLPSVNSNETVNPGPDLNAIITLSSDDEQNDFEPADNYEFNEDKFNLAQNPAEVEAPEVADVDIRMQNEPGPAPAINALVCYL